VTIQYSLPAGRTLACHRRKVNGSSPLTLFTCFVLEDNLEIISVKTVEHCRPSIHVTVLCDLRRNTEGKQWLHLHHYSWASLGKQFRNYIFQNGQPLVSADACPPQSVSCTCRRYLFRSTRYHGVCSSSKKGMHPAIKANQTKRSKPLCLTDFTCPTKLTGECS